MKKCTKCNELKSIDQFHNFKISPDGKAWQCKNCACLNKKDFYKKNAPRLRQDKRDYFEENSEKINNRNKTYKYRDIEAYNKKCRLRREIKKQDPIFILKESLRLRTLAAIKKGGYKKKKDKQNFLGVDFEVLKKHIERQFVKGMNWDNHGRGESKWQIDHIIPISTAKTEAEVYELSHYSNLQPLWAVDNIKKRAKIPPVQVSLNL